MKKYIFLLLISLMLVLSSCGNDTNDNIVDQKYNNISLDTKDNSQHQNTNIQNNVDVKTTETIINNQLLFILDASGSMNGLIGNDVKIITAKSALKSVLNNMDLSTRDTGLRVYGHTNKECNNSILENPLGDKKENLVSKIDSISATGKTPIGYSLEQSVTDFTTKNGQKVVVLLTDGKESCGSNVCEVAKSLTQDLDLVYVIGFGMSEEELATLNCIAEPFGTKVLSADDLDTLTKSLSTVLEEINNNVQISGLDYNGKGATNLIITQDGHKIYDEYRVNHKTTLQPGTYHFKVDWSQTDDVYEFDYEIKSGIILNKVINFDSGTVAVAVEHFDGTLDYTPRVVFYDNSGVKLSHGGNSANSYRIRDLMVGKYSVVYESLYTSFISKPVHFDIESKKENRFEIKLNDSLVYITKTNDVRTAMHIYDLKTNTKLLRLASNDEHKEYIQPGHYRIEITASGYKDYILDDVVLEPRTSFKKEITLVAE